MRLAVGPAALEHVVDVVVEEDVVSSHRDTPYARTACRRDTLCVVADIQKRGSYTPRRQREQRAYRLIVAGGVAGVVGVVGIVLAIAGVIGAGVPIIALIVAAICALMFSRTVGR